MILWAMYNLQVLYIIFERIKSGLSVNQNYSLTLIVEALAGSNTPVPRNFSKSQQLSQVYV